MRSLLVVAILFGSAISSVNGQQTSDKQRSRDVATEVMPVIELPLTVHDAALVKTEKTYQLKCRLSSSVDVRIIGIRYSLTAIDPLTGAIPLTNRIEGFELPAYDTKTIKFSTPISFHPKEGVRVVLMLEQVVSRESIWEVIKAKDALESYVKGDYSVQPHVMRVANQVDAPPQTRIIY
jgi:hypothetical protein